MVKNHFLIIDAQMYLCIEPQYSADLIKLKIDSALQAQLQQYRWYFCRHQLVALRALKSGKQQRLAHFIANIFYPNNYTHVKLSDPYDYRFNTMIITQTRRSKLDYFTPTKK